LSLEQDIQLLAGIELFQSFDPEQLRLLAFGSEKLNFPAETRIFYRDQPSDGGYAILEGKIELWVEDGEKKRTLGYFEAGDLLGELAILTRNKHVGSATTLTACRLMRISRSTMTRILEEYPGLAARLHDKIADEMVQFTRKLEPVQHKLQSGQ